MLLTMSCIKFCYAYINFKRTNQNSSPSKISQSINGERRFCDRNGTALLVKANSSFSESKKNFARWIKRETF